MEPISTTIASYATDKLIAIGEIIIKKQVIERWGRYRAEKFFETFCEQVIDLSKTDEEIQTTLEELLSDDVRSEILFDAYRSVCLTKSKSTGPRIIALLTAELVAVGRQANEDDEAIFSAAEELTDFDFEQLVNYVSDVERKVDRASDDATKVNGAFRILVGQHTSTSSWPSKGEISLAPLDLASHLGTWALKLKGLGLLCDEIKERQWRYQEDSERHIDEPGTAREISWWLTLERAAVKLAALSKRARKKDAV